MLEEERPNLLLLDIMMPKVDGLQLLAKMKADDRFRDVPVLMISSMPPEEATVKSLGLGAADFISKPFRVRELLARRSEEHTSELQSQSNLVCRLLLEKKKK